MTEKVLNLLNEQVQKEMYSAYLYLEMSNYYREEGLDGFSNWFYVQAQEEMSHAMLFREYILDNDGAVRLFDIEAPNKNYQEHGEPLSVTFEHEKMVSSSIHNLVAAAKDVNDFRTMEFLNWFVKEQGEEEKNAADLLKKFSLFGKDAQVLYQMDRELSVRAYSPPSIAST